VSADVATVNADSIPAFFAQVQDLTLQGYRWHEAGFTRLEPPFRLIADFIKEIEQ